MLSPVLWMVIGMGAVTYIPRMLPLVVLKTERIHPFIQSVLKNVPFAVLGALVFPGVFLINATSIYHMTLHDFLFGFIGGLVAFTVAYFELNLIFVVLSAILALSIYIGILSYF